VYIDLYGLAPAWVGPTGGTLGANGGAVIGLGLTMGNLSVIYGGLALAGLGGALTVWDWVTTPGEQLESILDQTNQIDRDMKKIQDLIDELNREDNGPDCE